MKTNAIISALCVVGIIGALCSNGEEQRSVVEPRPGTIPVQKVVYWSDIPGMKWDWGTQVTNAPSIPAKNVWYSECNTSGSPRVVTTTTGDFQLVDGAMITIYFKQTMSYDTTLNIDNTGAKSIVGSKIGMNAGFWWKTGGQTATFVYSASLGKYLYMEDEISATTGRYGVVQLVSSTNFAYESGYAATPKAVKMVADAIGAEQTARLNAGYATQTWVNDHKWDWTEVTNKPNVALADHTHSNLVNGASQVIANQNGTASIVTSGVEEKQNCMQIYIDHYGPEAFAKPITIKHHNTEAEIRALEVGDPFDFTVIYDGVSYECHAVLADSDERYASDVEGKPEWMNAVYVDPDCYVVTLHQTNPFGQYGYIGDGDEVKETYTYTSETSVSKTIATTDQLSNFVDKSVTNGLASTSWVNNHQWDWSTQITNAPSFVPTTRKVNNHALSSDVTLSGLDISATVTSPVGGPDIVNNVQGHLSFLYQDAYNTEQTLNLKADRTEIPTVPTNVSAFNNDANYTSGQIATNIARQIIHDAVSQVNVNLQSAEDTRVALTNLITILKNL